MKLVTTSVVPGSHQGESHGCENLIYFDALEAHQGLARGLAVLSDLPRKQRLASVNTTLELRNSNHEHKIWPT